MVKLCKGTFVIRGTHNMILNFTKRQYKYLVEMCLLGAYIIEESKIEVNADYKELLNQILLSNDENSIKASKAVFNSMEEIASTVIDNVNFNEDFLSNYNERNFWKELSIRMASRDALEELNHDVNEDNFSSYVRLREKYEKKYIEKFDIENYNNIELPY